MKKFAGPDFPDESLQSFAESKLKRKGLLSQKPIESYQIGPTFLRPFRQVKFLTKNKDSEFTSLIDEEFAGHITDPDEHFLLWRPRYIGLIQEECSTKWSSRRNTDDEGSILSVANDLILRRSMAQENLYDIREEISKFQSGWRSTSILFIPRSPTSIMKQEQTAKTKRAFDAIIRATSLVANCPDTAIIDSVSIEERIFVSTRLIMFYGLYDNSTRIIVLENPSASSINDSLSNGRALTRLFEINEKCRNLMIEHISDQNSL